MYAQLGASSSGGQSCVQNDRTQDRVFYMIQEETRTTLDVVAGTL
jgi:hypothetical protein